MDMINTATAMSASLLARDIYSVCFPKRDGLDSLRGELAAARKKFLTGGKKTVKVGKAEVIRGFEGKLQGKLARRGFYWKKVAGKVALEESFERKNGYVLVRRDFRGTIFSRVYFDKNHLWVKSEYFEPQNPREAQIILKPRDTSDLIERFDREPDGTRYRSVELYPLPYLEASAEQSVLNARFGEPGLIVSTKEGEFCYCPKKEAQKRLRALDDIKNGTIMLMPAWEVKNGLLSGENSRQEDRVAFPSLEEYARIQPGQDILPEAPAPAVPSLSSQEEEFTPEQEPAPVLQDKPAACPEDLPAAEETETAGADPLDEMILEAARKAAQQTPAAPEPQPGAAPAQGGVNGRSRSEQRNGLTAYEGEYRDGRREGFGSSYDRKGNLCYAGSWKNDKKDGLGVSFRDTDHALHIANWENGRPGGFVSLFDKDGNLRYGGRIENGKKEGVGISFHQSDGSVFVGKWKNGQPTGLGSSFDREGNLVYYGGWKDGKRNGHGTEFDGNGGIIYDGEWKDGKYHNGILYQKQPQNDAADDGEQPEWDL